MCPLAPAAASPWFKLGCLSGATAVALGAFGAHALRSRVQEPRLLETWDTASRYHFFHSIALCLAPLSRRSSTTGWLFAVGTLAFSGSLYALVLTGERRLGAVTPLGGFALICGWTAMSGAV